MIQQYVLLRKENDLLNSLIGQSFNQKSKFEAYKILNQIHEKAEEFSMEKALCYIVDKGEIKGVGGSSLMQNKKTGEIVSDLILNQMGIFMSGIFKGGTLEKIVAITDIINISHGVRVYSASSSNLFNSQKEQRILLKVGSGSTAPARSDIDIETSFGTAPESGNFESTLPVYNPALGNFKQNGSIIAGGAGTINESVLLCIWNDANRIDRVFTLFRDVISPGQSFIVGQSIALEYTTQL